MQRHAFLYKVFSDRIYYIQQRNSLGKSSFPQHEILLLFLPLGQLVFVSALSLLVLLLFPLLIQCFPTVTTQDYQDQQIQNHCVCFSFESLSRLRTFLSKVPSYLISPFPLVKCFPDLFLFIPKWKFHTAHFSVPLPPLSCSKERTKKESRHT